jgi:hypothetical protein
MKVLLLILLLLSNFSRHFIIAFVIRAHVYGNVANSPINAGFLNDKFILPMQLRK